MRRRSHLRPALLVTLAAALVPAACGSSTNTHGASPGADGGVTSPNPNGTDGSTPGADGSTPTPSSDGGAPLSMPDGGDGGIVLGTGRSFPDTNATIAILADQLPAMSTAQTAFAASHYVGTQKQLVPVTQALRALNPSFLVLHYHLAMWQSAPSVDFIVDGGAWGNDYPYVTTNETWFWHDTSNQRVASSADGKLLMNVSVPGFQQYWAQSLAEQVADGQYDAIFLDSASPALLQGECGTADTRLAGTGAKDFAFPELDGGSWIGAWDSWIGALSAALAAKGIPLIPNTSAFTTGWDTSNYGQTPGIFAEGFAGTGFAVSDWQASTNELLALSGAGKIVMLQNYLSATTDVATRLYYLGNYLLVKGHATYLDYFASGPLEWYPEWTIDLGPPLAPPAANVSALAQGGVYRRDFAKGSVLVNPTASAVSVTLASSMNLVTPTGGGAVDTTGAASGSFSTQSVTQVTVAATSAAIVLSP
jgi:hypothetical protein